jgi:hypothetical protein
VISNAYLAELGSHQGFSCPINQLLSQHRGSSAVNGIRQPAPAVMLRARSSQSWVCLYSLNRLQSRRKQTFPGVFKAGAAKALLTLASP